MEQAEERLRIALINEEENEIRRLVEEEGANPTALVYGQSALHVAFFRRNFPALRYFVEERRADVETFNSEGRTTLHCACKADSLEFAEYLIESGHADIEAKDKKNEQTPLHYACMYGFSTAISLYLIEHGANVDARDGLGQKALNFVLQSVGLDFQFSLDVLESCASQMDLARLLIPQTQLGEETMQDDCWTESWLPGDIRALLITTYATQNLALSKNYCQQFPIHTLFSIPLQSEEAFLGTIHQHRNDTSSRSLDSNDRLPIHVALEARSSNEAVTPRVIFELLEPEPRSAFVRDPKSGFYPFEAAACARQVTGPYEHRDKPKSAVFGGSETDFCALAFAYGTYQRDKHKEEHHLNLIYQLFRCNPHRLLTSRGVVHGGSTTSSATRESKRRKIAP